MSNNSVRCYNRRTMKTFKLLLLIVVFAGVTVAQTTKTQTPQQQTPPKPAGDDISTLRVNATLVNTLFTVADKKGKFITNLKQSDFKVFEDEKPQTVTAFSGESESAAEHRPAGGYQRQYSRQTAIRAGSGDRVLLFDPAPRQRSRNGHQF